MSEKKEIEIKDDTLIGRIKNGKFSRLQDDLETIVAKKIHMKIKEKIDAIKNPHRE